MTRFFVSASLMTALMVMVGCTAKTDVAPAEAPEAAEAAPAEAAPAEAAPAEAAPAEAAPAEAAPTEAAPSAAATDAEAGPSLIGKWSVDVEAFKASPMYSQLPEAQQGTMLKTLGLLTFEFTATDFVYGHGPRTMARKYTVTSNVDKKTVISVTDAKGNATDVNVMWTEKGITIQEQNRPGPLPLVRN